MTQMTFVSNTPKPPHAQEPEEVWIDRVLGLPEGPERAFQVTSEESCLIRDPSGQTYSRLLPTTRIRVLRHLADCADNPQPLSGYEEGDGVALVLTNLTRSRFLLTRKDNKHPNPRCVNRYCLLGGNVEKNGGDFSSTIFRELYEEVRDMALADSIASRIQFMGIRKVPSVQWAGEFRCGAYIAQAPDNLFAVWAEYWGHPRVLSEAFPVVVTGEHLDTLLVEEEQTPGSQFIASHNRFLRMTL